VGHQGLGLLAAGVTQGHLGGLVNGQLQSFAVLHPPRQLSQLQLA